MAGRGFAGGFWCNDTILWFIILFLLLFWGRGGIGYDGVFKE